MKWFLGLLISSATLSVNAEQISLDLPRVPIEDYTADAELLCALRMLHWAAVDTTLTDLSRLTIRESKLREFDILLTPFRFRNLLEGFRLSSSLKRHAEMADLKRIIDQGIPVLVLCHVAGTEKESLALEWRIVSGSDNSSNSIYLIDGNGTIHVASESVFRQQWQFSLDETVAARLHACGITKGSMIWIRRQDAVQQVIPMRETIWAALKRSPDAIVRHPTKDDAFFFMGENFLTYDFEIDTMTKPAKIDSFWTGLPSPIDAAVNHPNGKVYFFKDDRYYRFSFKTQQIDKEGLIGIDGWRGLVPGIDAGLIHPNGKAYFFKGTQYFRFNFKSDRVDKLATINRDGWRGVPDKVGSAFYHSNGIAILFKESQCYEYEF